MDNIFEDAYFGKLYKTRDGRKAIFHNRKLTRILGKGLCECFHLICDRLDREIECYCDGRESLFHDDVLDIVSEWHEEINEEEPDRLAIEHSQDNIFYIPIPQNKETQKQVQAILAIEKLKKEFNAMNDEDKRRIMELL